MITVHPPAVPYPDGADWGLSPGMRVATRGGDDGSELVVRSIAEAPRCLKDGGRLLLLLPHWSNVQRAWDELRKHYAEVTELSRKQVEFFPARGPRIRFYAPPSFRHDRIPGSTLFPPPAFPNNLLVWKFAAYMAVGLLAFDPKSSFSEDASHYEDLMDELNSKLFTLSTSRARK